MLDSSQTVGTVTLSTDKAPIGPIIKIVVPREIKRPLADDLGNVVFFVSMPTGSQDMGLVRDSMPGMDFAESARTLHFQAGSRNSGCASAPKKENKYMEVFLGFVQGAIGKKEFKRDTAL